MEELSEKLTIRPYARLITMLGDQLIKNEVIALVELIKNSYDADASWVKVSFLNFNEDYSSNENSKIVIEDDGCGMNADILRKHWLNPATPEKLRRKKIDSKTPKGRILQGEKGIGRFAVFKLGKNIKITSRRQLKNDDGVFIDEGEKTENTLIYDFSKYDEDFLTENGESKDVFLENLEVELTESEPQQIISKEISLGVNKQIRKPYGTIIEISGIKTKWTTDKVERVQREVGKLQPIFLDETNDFHVWIYKDFEMHESHDRYKALLKNCLENKAVFKVTNGHYINSANKISFLLNDEPITFSLFDEEIKGLRKTKRFIDSDRKPDCGDFKFEFYIFDLNADSDNPSKYYLDSNEKRMIREHRIYLYRDGIRVMPYGDPEDDWLRLDMDRGTVRANEFFSNDQVVGCVYISQNDNPKLKDKTNREGLIEEDQALGDFINILQIILSYLRSKPFARYLLDKEKKKEIDRIKKGRPFDLIENARKKFSDDKNVGEFLDSFENSYSRERKVFQERIYKTENLAAVGLSVETASHDVMLFLRRGLEEIDSLVKEISAGGALEREQLVSKLIALRGTYSMVETMMKDIQLLFPSTKSKTKNIRVREIIEKVKSLYNRQFKEANVTVDIQGTKNPLVVRTTDAVLLQVFINLFDNSLYWLKTVNRNRIINIYIDGDDQRVIFADNGPGVKDDDLSYIFEAFYSGKGEEGRGLGLYIARQLLDRYDYSIDLAEFKKDQLLSGANFVIDFAREDQ